MSEAFYRRRLPIALVIIALPLIAVRAVLPIYVQSAINTTLMQLQDYQGEVADVDLALWRGAYALHGLHIEKRGESNPEPLVRAKTTALSLSWPALFNGAIVAELDIHGLEVHFIDTPGADDQTGEDEDWRQLLKDLTPITINRLQIHDSSVRFHNYQSDPPVNLALSQLQIRVSNINNADRSQGEQLALILGRGQLFEHAPFELYGILDPLGEFQNFDINLKVSGVELKRINALTRAYANFDFKSGHGDYIMELRADAGQLEGYAKPLLDNVDILDSSETGRDEGLGDVIAGSLGWLLRNHEKDRIGTQIEIRGNLQQDNISVWQAFLSILHNAYVEAYESRFGRE